MIIAKTIVLDISDIFAAVKMFIEAKKVAAPSDVCSITLIRSDTYDENKLIVQLSDEYPK